SFVALWADAPSLSGLQAAQSVRSAAAAANRGRDRGMWVWMIRKGATFRKNAQGRAGVVCPSEVGTGDSAVSRDVSSHWRSRWTNVRGVIAVDAEHSSDVFGARSSSGTRTTPAGGFTVVKAARPDSAGQFA